MHNILYTMFHQATTDTAMSAVFHWKHLYNCTTVSIAVKCCYIWTLLYDNKVCFLPWQTPQYNMMTNIFLLFPSYNRHFWYFTTKQLSVTMNMLNLLTFLHPPLAV